jgi:hypothetical protein
MSVREAHGVLPSHTWEGTIDDSVHYAAYDFLTFGMAEPVLLPISIHEVWSHPCLLEITYGQNHLMQARKVIPPQAGTASDPLICPPFQGQ